MSQSHASSSEMTMLGPAKTNQELKLTPWFSSPYNLQAIDLRCKHYPAVTQYTRFKTMFYTIFFWPRNTPKRFILICH